MAQPKRAMQVEPVRTELPQAPMSEEMVAVKLFEEMVKRVDEVYTVALELENTPRLAKLLGEVGGVKVTLQGIIEQLREEEEMRKNEEELMRVRAMEVENG